MKNRIKFWKTMIAIAQIAVYLAVLKYIWWYLGRSTDIFVDDTARDIELLVFGVFYCWVSWMLNALWKWCCRRDSGT